MCSAVLSAKSMSFHRAGVEPSDVRRHSAQQFLAGGRRLWAWLGMGGFGVIFWLIIPAIVIACVVWLVRSVPQTNKRQPLSYHRSSGLEALDERYARRDQPRRVPREEARHRQVAGLARPQKWVEPN